MNEIKYGVILSPDEIKKQKMVLLVSNVQILHIAFEIRKEEQKCLRWSYFSRPDETKHMHFWLRNAYVPKGQSENVTMCDVKWADVINDSGRSYCISPDTSDTSR